MKFVLLAGARAAAACLLFFACLPPVYGQQSQNPVPTPAPHPAHALDPSLRDTSTDPCVDLYQYACGGWLKQNPIPSDRAGYGRGEELGDQNELVLKTILEKAAAGGATRTSNEQKIGDAYAACMNTDAINAAGVASLQAELARITQLESKTQLPALAATLAQDGVMPLFSFSSSQDFRDATQQIGTFSQPELGLPERGYYERTDGKSVELRAQYSGHIARSFVLLGETEKQAQANAVTVLKIESAMAASSLTRVEMRDPSKLYHKTPLVQFAANSPAFSVVAFLRDLQAPRIASLNDATPAYFLGLNELLASMSLPEIKTYLRWALLRSVPGTALPQPLDDEQFNFYSKVLRGQPEQQPRWKRCVASVDSGLGEALGEVFVAQRFSPEDKQRTLELTRDVEAAMGRDIDQLDWMSPATKAQAREKLAAVANKIGYPDKWRDYSKLTIVRDSDFANELAESRFETHRQLTKIGQPVDRGEWGMSPPTVNAYYNPQMNDINFPAGILQPPYFDPSQDDAVNYGDAGGVIGHELSHGFDDEGRQFDAHGNFRNWWKKTDEAQFTRRAQCVVDEYDRFIAVDDLHVNGQLTIGENLADLAGLRLAFLAYLDRAAKAPAGPAGTPAEYGDLTPQQQFFVAYAQGWCENRRPEDLRMGVQTDPHSPEKFRVNGVVVNLPEFQQAFQCRTGQPMAPAKRCSVW